MDVEQAISSSPVVATEVTKPSLVQEESPLGAISSRGVVPVAGSRADNIPNTSMIFLDEDVGERVSGTENAAFPEQGDDEVAIAKEVVQYISEPVPAPSLVEEIEMITLDLSHQPPSISKESALSHIIADDNAKADVKKTQEASSWMKKEDVQI
eukprot:scaffold4037_cov189-Ochromonas_danica.AAC.1